MLRRKVMASLFSFSILANTITPVMLSGSTAYGAPGGESSGGRWMTGEYHAHTTQSDDAQGKLEDVLDAAFDNYNLDWLALSDHLRMSSRDDEGNTLSSPIPLSQGIAEYQAPQIKALQDSGKYADKTIFTGFEWDMPTYDHVGVGIVTDDPGSEEALKAISQFEYLFTNRDASLFSAEDVAAWSAADSRAYTTAGDTRKAYQWLADNYPDSYALINHPSRKNGTSSELKVSDIRDFNNIAPNIAFGFEGLPGNQMAPDRGETTEVYGGADVRIAKVGGMWDALLGEGRHFWNFANSDFHFNISSDRKYSSGYWPGQYSKNYTWVEGSGMKAIVDGMRSGKSFSATGDLINALDFRIGGGSSEEEMGGDLEVPAGEELELTIRFKSPETNNNGDAVKVDHVDLISGDVTGKAEQGTDAYTKATNDSAKVVKRFTSADWTTDADGYNTITYTIGTAEKNQYFRLRGTNLGTDVAGETSGGEPLIDPKNTTADNETRFTEINNRNYSDMWFYSNPIFVNATYTDDQAVQEALDNIDFPSGKVTAGFTLPAAGAQGAAITWTSSDPATATVTGNAVQVNRPALGQPDGKVTLTATATKGDESDSRSFELTVKALGANDPLLRYTFDADAGNGTAVSDVSGHGHNGTLIGGAALTSEHGGAVTLDGSNDAVQLPNGILAGLTDATVTMSVNVDASLARPAWLFTFATASAAVSGTKYFGLLEDSSGKFRSAITANWYTAEQNVSKGSALGRGVWKSLAYTISGTTGTLYEDGVQVAQNTGLTLAPKDIETTVANYLGRPAYAGDKYFKGKISDFRIYSRALTAEEVAGVAGEEDEGAVADDLSALSLGDTSAVTANLTLPVSGAYGSVISWQSGDTAVVANDGTVTRQNNSTAAVTLTATVQKGTASAVKTFQVTVLGTGDAEAVELDSQAIHLGTAVVQNDLTLPSAGANGSVIQWKSSNEAVLDTDGTVHRPAAAENAEVTLTATVTKGSAEATRSIKLVVLSQTPVLAHWKFSQDNVQSGTLDNSNLRLGDLSGLGNDLTLVTTGNGLSAEAASMLQWSEDGQSLVFGNYRGASAGKYFKTVDGAPINSEEFTNGYTIEAVFKMPQGFTPAKNQWTGLLTRQGTGKEAGKTAGETEILSTLSVSNLRELQWESYPTNLNNNPTAWSFTLDNSSNWYHAAIVNDGHYTKLYIDGVTDFRNPAEEVTGIESVSGKGWNIGASEWDGAIDGLFAGTLEEIKITANALPENEWIVQDFDTDGLIEGNNDDQPLVSSDDTYSLAFIPDTQNEVRYQPEIFYTQMQWLADHYKELNIPMTVSLGDIVDQSWVGEQWTIGDKGYDMLDEAGAPFIVTRGNHDVGGSGANTYANLFGESRFADKAYWHGGSPSGYSSYVIYEAGSYKYMILSIDREVFGTDLAWAKGVLAANSNLPTIVYSHEILEIGGDGSLVYSGNGQSLFDNLVKNNNQVFMTIAGHNHGTDYRIVKNASGNDVIEMLVDYQSYYHGGNGWLRFMEMDEANNQLTFRTYSPWVDTLSEADRTFFDLTHLNGSTENFTTAFNFDQRFSFYNKVGSLAGKVTDGTNPLEGALISIAAGGQTYTAETSADGSYSVAGIPAGEGYTVMASKAGYGAAELTEIGIRANKITEGDLQLEPLSSVYYKVMFDANGGDTAADPAEKMVIGNGNAGVLPEPPVRSGYIFTGWNSEPDGSGTAFTAGTEVTADLTVYAQWTDLVLRYTFDTNTANGATVPDHSGNGNSGSLLGGAALTAAHGGSVKLDGTDDAVQLPNGILKGLNEATFTMNVKVDSSLARPAWLFTFASAAAAVSGTKYIGVLEDSSGKFRGAITNNWYTGEQITSKGSALDQGVWTSIAYQISGTTGTLYVDGVQVAQNTGVTLTPADMEATVANYLGRPAYSGDKYFKGEISDFRIYSRALTTAELQVVAAEDLAEYGMISGTVTDGNDPLAGAAVEVTVDGIRHQAVTGTAGSYTLGSIPAGSGYTVTASKPGYEAASADNVEVAADSVTGGLDLALNAIVHTVTFNKNGGSAEADPAELTVREGQSAGTLPAPPVREGYLFKGWNTAADGSGTAFTAATPVLADLAVYAQWQEEERSGSITGTVTDGALPVAAAVVQVTVSGSVYSAFTNSTGQYTITGVPEGSGYTVTASKAGYLDGSAAEVNVTANETTSGVDIALGLVVVITEHTVVFDSNGGDTAANPAEVNVTDGGSLGALPAPPAREGYLFNGWNTAADGSGTAFTASTPVNADLTVYAQWQAVAPGEPEENSGSITGTVTDGTLPVAVAVVKVTVSGSVYSSLTNNAGQYSITGVPEGSGYTVTASKAGYLDGSAADVTVTAKETTGGVDIVLQAEVVIKTVTVTFNENGGTTEASPAAMSVKEGESLNALPAAPARSGYTFSGWNTAADGSGTSFTAETPVTSDLTVYAKWQQISTNSLVSVNVAPASMNLTTGSSQASVVTATYSNGATVNVTENVSWSSDKPAVATVSGSGVVTGVAQGSATITGYYGDFTVTISVVVKAKSTATGETVTTAPSTGTDTNTNTDTDTSVEVPVTPAPSDLFNSSVILSDAGVLQHLNTLLKSGTGTASFSDVGTHWAQKAIALFSKLNVVDGYGDGSFKPNTAVTRAEFAVLIDRVFDIVPGGTHKAVMNDISSHWAEDTIAKLTSAGVLNGYGSSFRPDQNISRAEMVTVISRIVNLDAAANSGTNATFSDVGDSFAAKQIAAAAGAGIVTGKGGGKFDPEASSTRAEAVTILLNTLKLSPEIKTFLDGLE